MKQSSLFRQIVSCKYYTATIISKLGKVFTITWENTNKFLFRDDCTGIKTGITPSAGPCLATSFKVGKRSLIFIVLNVANMERRFLET